MSVSLRQSAFVTAIISAVVAYFIQLRSNAAESESKNSAVVTLLRLIAISAVSVLGTTLIWLQLYYRNWWADFLYFTKLVRWDISNKAKMKAGSTILDVFDRHVNDHPDHPCILYNDEVYSYEEVDAHANRVARWVNDTAPGLEKGEAVGILLYNGPEYAWTVMGLMKLGVVPSLINTNLKAAGILHCLQASDAKKFIFEAELWPVVSEILPELNDRNIDVWMVDDEHSQNIKMPSDVVVMDTMKMSGIPYARDPFFLTDMAVYIFTSGTTCMPKPVNVFHRKIIRTTYLHFFSHLSPDDVYYIALPMYHAAALLQSTFSIWYHGGTVAIARKFSASRFWDDIRKHQATCFHYVGESCRYLLAQPKRADDGVYPRKIRLAQGNGLRPDIWRQFQERFKVGQIFEIYAATEGNFGMINIDGKVGTVGRYPWFMQKSTDSLEIVDYDYASGEAKRGPNGHCILLPRGKTGLALNKISDDHPYTGYKGTKQMNESKVVRNVKAYGDAYFNTGDLLLLDEDGYAYFKDRVGDIFRWKGENVSTNEVSQVVSTCQCIMEANVYGIRIPGCDGRAGMAAVVLRNGFMKLDGGTLYAHVTSSLPSYACPKFIRVVKEMEVTGTFKHKKVKLVEEGWDMGVIKDPLYVVDESRKEYVPMAAQHADMINDGRLTF